MTSSRKLLIGDLAAVFLAAIAIGILFIKEPGLGDDFTYWGTAWEIHTRGGSAWDAKGFHDLRWPVWGFIWILQGIVGPGIFSFYAVPHFYLALGAIVAFVMGKRLLGVRSGAWACVLAFLFHPLLDGVIYRPMPDLPEGTLTGIVVLCWLGLVETDRTRVRFFLAAAAGFVAALLFANRLTGVFVFGVLAATALASCWKNPRFTFRQAAAWLGCIGLVWLIFVSIEGLIYYRLTGDFLHNIHANLSARGHKGTGSVPLWTLPFRFFDSLWKTGRLSPFYTTFALVGGWHLWRRGGVSGRVVVAWGVALYLAYSCALQSFFPPRPLLREADRFLCALALPISILSVGGLWFVWSYWPRGVEWTRKRPVVVACAAVLLLALIGDRPFFSLGYIPKLRAYLETVPPGSRIFTHYAMRNAAFLAAPRSASGLQWNVTGRLLHRSKKLEKMAAGADEFWYCRKITWLVARQNIEKKKVTQQAELGTYLEKPELEWVLQRVIDNGGNPEFVFYRKRESQTPVPAPVAANTVFPALPAQVQWNSGGERRTRRRVAIPEALRGKAIRLTGNGFSNETQAATAQLNYYRGEKLIATNLLKPYFHPTRAMDFFALQIPADADSCEIVTNVSPKAREIDIDQLQLLIEPEGVKNPRFLQNPSLPESLAPSPNLAH